MDRRGIDRSSSGRPVYRVAAPEAKKPSVELLEEALRIQRSHARRRLIRTTLVLLCVVGLVWGGWTGFNYYRRQKLLAQIPSTIRQTTPFPIYVPLEAVYKLNPNSFSYSQGVLVFTATLPSGTEIYFSEQTKPQDFNFDFFYSKQLQATRELNTPSGKAYIGTTKGRGNLLTVSLVAEPTWILVTTPTSVKQSELDQMLLSLRSID